MWLKKLYLFIFLIINVSLIINCHADFESQVNNPQPTQRKESLLRILNSINKLEAELIRQQEELHSPSGRGRTTEITQQILASTAKIQTLQDSFDELASGVDKSAFEIKQDIANEDWGRDLREIMSPLVNEVKRLTSRPREIDRLKTEIEEYKSQLLLMGKALGEVTKLAANEQDARLLSSLEKSAENWRARQQGVITQLSIAEQRLQQRLSERQTFSESVQNIFQLFFKSRGLNFILALFSALVFWIVARRLYKFGSFFNKYQEEERALGSRLFYLFYLVATLLGTIAVFLLALYFLGDWVLLILALMLILGIIWTSKQAVHQFWTHATLLLNVGTVREGERLIYLGVPWLVESLNVYSNLSNPALAGGNIKIPVRDLAGMRSRPFDQNEPWFPSLPGDWVQLNDGTFGQIIIQTIERVQVRLLGGGIKNYSTSAYIDQAPCNLSNGFRVCTTLGLDYKHIEKVTGEIIGTLKSSIAKLLIENGINAADITSLQVQFQEAASSALILLIQLDLKGIQAARYQELNRLLQKICVETAISNQWEIPFEQLTLHVVK